jgi:lactate permease
MLAAPRDWSSGQGDVAVADDDPDAPIMAGRSVARAWTPWVILSVLVFAWGTPQVKAWLDGIWIARFPVAGCTSWSRRCRRWWPPR